MMRNYDYDFNKFDNFAFDPFMELKGARVTDEHYTVDGGNQGSIVSWLKSIFVGK